MVSACVMVTTWSALIRPAADTSQTLGGHVMLHQESQCLISRDSGICGDREKSKILSRRKREGKETNGHNKSCWLTSLLGSILYCPVVVSHSWSHSQIRGSLAIKVITALIRAEIHPPPSSLCLIVPDNGVTMGAWRLRMNRNADVEADNQTLLTCWPGQVQPPVTSLVTTHPMFASCFVSEEASSSWIFPDKRQQILGKCKEEADACLQKQEQIISKL